MMNDRIRLGSIVAVIVFLRDAVHGKLKLIRLDGQRRNRAFAVLRIADRVEVIVFRQIAEVVFQRGRYARIANCMNLCHIVICLKRIAVPLAVLADAIKRRRIQRRADAIPPQHLIARGAVADGRLDYGRAVCTLIILLYQLIAIVNLFQRVKCNGNIPLFDRAAAIDRILRKDIVRRIKIRRAVAGNLQRIADELIARAGVL